MQLGILILSIAVTLCKARSFFSTAICKAKGDRGSAKKKFYDLSLKKLDVGVDIEERWSMYS